MGRHAAQRDDRADPEHLHAGRPHAQHPRRDDRDDAAHDHCCDELFHPHAVDHVGHDDRRPYDATGDDDNTPAPAHDRHSSDHDSHDDHAPGHDDRPPDHRDDRSAGDGRNDDAWDYRDERVKE